MARPRAIMPVATSDDKYIRMMLYGEPGVGKSVFAGTSPKCLILANNSGEVTSPAGMGSTADVWVVPTYDDVDEAWEYLRHEGHKTYDWVWFDNLTLFQEQAMDKIMEDLVRERPHRNRWVPDQHEYLVNQNRMGTMVRSFLKLPMHLGFTAHVMRTEDDDGKVVYLPMLQGGQGALSQKFCGYMNVVGYMQATRRDGEQKRTMILDKRGKYLAKCRFAGVPGQLDNPNVPLLQQHVAATTVPTSGAASRTPRKTTATTRKRSPK